MLINQGKPQRNATVNAPNGGFFDFYLPFCSFPYLFRFPPPRAVKIQAGKETTTLSPLLCLFTNH